MILVSFAVVFVQSIEARSSKDVVGGAPTGDADIWVINNFIAYQSATYIRGFDGVLLVMKW